VGVLWIEMWIEAWIGVDLTDILDQSDRDAKKIALLQSESLELAVDLRSASSGAGPPGGQAFSTPQSLSPAVPITGRQRRHVDKSLWWMLVEIN
jgi:hypothetical protein